MINSKSCVKRTLSKRPKVVLKINYHLMQAKREHSAILSTFIKLLFAIKIFVLSIFEWPFYTGLTVFLSLNVVLILANSADHDEMQLYAAFHLGFHCLPKYPFRGVQYTKSYELIISLSPFVN